MSSSADRDQGDRSVPRLRFDYSEREMNIRSTVFAGALALALTAPQATLQTAAAASSVTARGSAAATDRSADADDGLKRLKADASGKLRVHRADDGLVDFVSSTNGRAMVEAEGTKGPAGIVADHLGRYGDAFGIDGGRSRAVVERSFDSATGGSVVRAEQVVDGVPVFGGQVVMSLDEDQGVVSVDAATTEATEVPAAVVGEAKARNAALAVTAKSHRVARATLKVSSVGRHLYDPAIVHTEDPMGVRPVWQFEVSNGSDIRETVLVGTDRGEVALHFNDAPSLNRVVCDNAGRKTVSSDADVPVCATPARTETGPASAVTDVNAAFANLGATSTAYVELDGIDLTALIGVGSPKALTSTVRWCFKDDTCPYDNAFWDGRQMVFGAGYAGADDVVGHELTHGYVDRTSQLFWFHQSGAINESVSDVIGEIVDHRNNPDPSENNSKWQIGEDLPGATTPNSGLMRSLKDPPLFNQPDKMTSPKFVNTTYDDDGGAVHDNDGVGNKTAYLISQGGSFNGRTITGIDGGDAGLAKTGRLYLETIPRLTSGAEYADLGRVLGTTCDELAAAATGGFTTADCASVRLATAATELSSRPAAAGAAAPEVAISCPAAASIVTLKRDDDGVTTFGFGPGSLWQRTPARGTPNYAVSGVSSWFGLDPDPEQNGIYASGLTSAPFAVPRAQPTYLHFNHAYVFEGYPAEPGLSAFWPDGGQVLVQTLSGSTWTTRSVPWNNGPTKNLGRSTTKVFGGDSHGYGSSRIDLTSLAGQTVRVVFKVQGDEDVAELGWWVDDIRAYTCPNAVASVPVTTAAAGTSSVTLSWQPPAYVGSSPVASYRITRSDGKITEVPSTTRSVVLGSLNPSSALTVSVAAVVENGRVGAPGTVRIDPTATTTTSSATKVVKNKAFIVTGKVVRRGTTTPVAGMPLLLQKRLSTQSTWTNVIGGTTASNGTKSWGVKQNAATYWRVIAKGSKTLFGSISGARGVTVR
jgi:bacillolysin